MTDCMPQLAFSFHSKAVIVSLDAPTTSTDGGLLLLRSVDERLKLTEALSGCLVDSRDEQRVRHSRREQLRQRIFQIAMGYPDQNDATALRSDAMLQVACDVEPGRGELSSQPTLSRFENSMNGRELNGLMRVLEEQFVAGLEPDRRVVVLDIDSTDDPTHGQQELSCFNGFYDEHMYHPLLVFDGETGRLALALLRPGRAPSARGATTALTRLIRSIRQRCPRAVIVVRGDAAFSQPKLMTALEGLDRALHGVKYIFGLAANPRLTALAAPILRDAEIGFEVTGEDVRDFGEIQYAAGTWPSRRRVIVRADHTSMGRNTRYVVTSLVGATAQEIYERWYCHRGNAENFIKDFKNAIEGDRLSCGRFAANALRLILHGAAYALVHELREEAGTLRADIGRLQMDTLRLQLLKVAAVVTTSFRRIKIALPRSFPLAKLFHALALQLGAATYGTS